MKQFVVSVVAAYVRKNPVSPDDLPRLIVFLDQVFRDLEKSAAKPASPIPAVPIRRSVGADKITCLTCGWSGRLLRSHLSRTHAMSPMEYLIKWGLPRAYPMVAANYSARRSALSKSLGLGGWHDGTEQPPTGKT